LAGVVSSPLEVGMIKGDPETQDLFAMIPGTRSASADHGDQARVTTPAVAIQDGADLLVIGRQISQAENPAAAFEAVVAEIGVVL
jgi:orotidine-5'-phosphate decarboxylase